MGHSAESSAGPCEDFDEHACPVYCNPDCLSRARAHVTPPGTQADYLLDGSPEAVAIVREARGLPPLDTRDLPPAVTEADR
jgi:hypothetical protein